MPHIKSIQNIHLNVCVMSASDYTIAITEPQNLQQLDIRTLRFLKFNKVV